MSETTMRTRHATRNSQIRIYLRKQFRFFIYGSDWKFLPMAAIIALLVGLVIKNKFFVNMEGSLIGAFALAMVAIWNGCFNSIQAICRERGIIKREHRSGMHVSSYVFAHMVYQFCLCLAQTVLTMLMLLLMQVPIPEKGIITPWMVVDVGITMLLISYAADMMSLFLSSICKTTTGAMTVMPFILIFQLVFSGGIIPLPAWTSFLSDLTISNYGIKAIAAQSDYNNLPMVAVWNTLSGMRDTEIGGTYTVEELLALLDNPAIDEVRDTEVMRSYTVGEVADILTSGDEYLQLREKKVANSFTLREMINVILTDEKTQDIRDLNLVSADGNLPGLTLGEVLTALSGEPAAADLLDKEMDADLTLGQVLDGLKAEELVNLSADQPLNDPVTVGRIVDFLRNNNSLKEKGSDTITLKTTMGQVFDFFGEENIKNIIEEKTGEAAFNPDYVCTLENILHNWLMIGVFIAVFALAAAVLLEFIDRDKR